MPRDHILVVGPSWVGDMVMAQSLFIELKKRHSGCRIDVLAPSWTFPLLDRMPEVNRGYPMPVGHGQLDIVERYRQGKRFRAEKYDQAIVLPNSFKSALIPAFAKIPLRTGWRGELRYGLLNDLRILDPLHLPLMVERFVALAFDGNTADREVARHRQALPNPALKVDAAQRDVAIAAFNLELHKPVLALCPGAEFGAAKQWPAEHYAALAEHQIEQGWQVWLFGSANDQGVCESIRHALHDGGRASCVNLAGRTELAQAIDLLSLAEVVTSNDSGLMHVAAALGRKVIAIYGSTSPGFTPPLAKQVEIVSIPVDCGPCFQRECPHGHLKCLRDLLPAQVIAALDRLQAMPTEVAR